MLPDISFSKLLCDYFETQAEVHYDYLSAVQLAANQDGISDICAFIAGALKGALLGYSEIPSGFVKKLQFADMVKDYAARLTKAAPKGFMNK